MDDIVGTSTRAVVRRGRRAVAERIAARQDGVVSRRQLYAAGITRAEVRANVRAHRWRRLGSQSIVVHRGPLTLAARHWAAVFEAGPRAYLDGGSALVAAGLERFSMERIRVSVPRGARVRRGKGIDIRQTRRWDPTDLAPCALPRSREEVAAVRHALWARSDREATYILTRVVQDGLVSLEMLTTQLLRVRRDKRRELVHEVLVELAGGVRSLGELDVARECRRRGLPEPSRQVLRKSRHGRYYLDVFWDDYAVVLEIDGIHHAWVENVVPDALRQNAITLTDAMVLRLPLLGLRIAADEFFGQVEQALVSRGWDPVARRTA
jgi:very-short-patch-repair endonuclease